MFRMLLCYMLWTWQHTPNRCIASLVLTNSGAVRKLSMVIMHKETARGERTKLAAFSNASFSLKVNYPLLPLDWGRPVIIVQEEHVYSIVAPTTPRYPPRSVCRHTHTLHTGRRTRYKHTQSPPSSSSSVEPRRSDRQVWATWRAAGGSFFAPYIYRLGPSARRAVNSVGRVAKFAGDTTVTGTAAADGCVTGPTVNYYTPLLACCSVGWRPGDNW